MHICLMTRATLHHGAKGGMELHARALSEGLAERGHRITVLTTQDPLGRTEARDLGIRTLFVSGTLSGRYSRAWGRRSAAALAHLHSEDPVDLIWSQSIGAYGVLRAPRHRLPIPCVAMLHGTPLGEWRGKRRQWGASPRHAAKLARFAARTAIQHRLFAEVVAKADALVCVSRSLAEEMAEEFGARHVEITVIPNGVDVALFAPRPEAGQALREQLNVPDGAPVLLTAGRLEQAKGHHLALEVLARLRSGDAPAVLLVAGEGADEAWLRRRAERRGLEGSVRWLGRVPHESMPAAYAAADVVLMLSLLSEAFPYSVIEAMACGRAVVASRVGGVPDAITDGRDGILVPPDDVARAAEETVALLGNAERRLQMGQAARETVQRRFTLARMVADTEALFVRCASSCAPGDRS